MFLTLRKKLRLKISKNRADTRVSSCFDRDIRFPGRGFFVAPMKVKSDFGMNI
jgi:hypothetical protein